MDAEVSQKPFLCRASQQGQNARNWQQPIIPRIRIAFRGTRTVPSKGWLSDAGRERHLTVDSCSCESDFQKLLQSYSTAMFLVAGGEDKCDVPLLDDVLQENE